VKTKNNLSLDCKGLGEKTKQSTMEWGQICRRIAELCRKEIILHFDREKNARIPNSEQS
jgi:hypothetical protein